MKRIWDLDEKSMRSTIRELEIDETRSRYLHDKSMRST